MKKLIAMLLAAVMALGCTACFAEGASATTIESADGTFKISMQLPENTELLSGDWSEDGLLYQANIKGSDNLYYYMAVAAPEAKSENAEEESYATYSEEFGYTDDYLKSMIDELFADDSSNYDKGVSTTAYGTKLAVVRFNDSEAPSAYIFTMWKGYEIGVTVVNIDPEGNFRLITDDQVQKVTDFLSEVWMNNKEAEAPAA